MKTSLHASCISGILCILLSLFVLAACGNGDIESGSMGQKISKTEISRQDEQPSEGESGFAEVSEPVSEEISEPVSEEVSRKDPEQHIDPEDFPYRVVSAHSAAELVAKLKDISDKINGNKASDFNMKDIDYLEPIDDILSLGYIFNPSVDGIYAENDSEEPHGKIEMVFRADHTVTAIYYCRNDDDIWASIQIVYPNADIIRLTGEYGAEGLGMYNAKSNKRITEMTEQQQTNAGFRNATIENITLEGQIYDSMKYARSSGGTTTTIVYEGIPVVISYKYNSEELKATHNADEILDTIKLEKLYFPAE